MMADDEVRALTFPEMDAALNPLEEAQLRSAQARAIFENSDKAQPWMDDYWRLLAEGWTWRQAVYILWASQPADRRRPKTQGELAVEYLGLTSDRAIREWKSTNPAIENRIHKLAFSVVAKRRSEVLHALAESASRPDYKHYNDRRLLLEITGDYIPRRATLNINTQVSREEMEGMDSDDLRDIVDANFAEVEE